MQSHAHPLFLLYLIAAAQGVFLLLALHYRQHFKIGDKWAQSLFLGILSYHILYFGLMWSGFLKHLPVLLYTGGMATTAIPMAWYFYQKKSQRQSEYRWYEWLPAVWLGYLFINYLYSFSIPASAKLEYYEQQVLAEQTHRNWLYLRNTGVIILQAICYLVLTRKSLWQQPKKELSQLYLWLVAFTILLSLHFTFCYFGTAGYALTYCSLVALECLMVYRLTWSYIQPKMNTKEVQVIKEVIVEKTKPSPTPSPVKYQKSNLCPKLATATTQRLTDLMQGERLFLQPNLRQTDLATAVELSRHQLSEVLTQELQTNYYDFVNRYRVEYAQELLVADKKRAKTILAIAYEAGFNSKNAFNTAFKKFTQTTPSAYQRARIEN